MEDKRILIINKDIGEGVSATRNRGLEIATGDYIAFVDSDDELHPQYFELLLKGAIENNSDLITCRYIQTSDLPMSNSPVYTFDKDLIHSYTFEEEQNDYQLKSFVWGSLYKNEILKGIQFDTDLKLG